MELVKAQNHLAKHDPQLKLLIERFGDCQLQPHTDYYAELVSSIVSQQLSVKAAASIWKRLLGLFGDTLPTPAQLQAVSHEELRAAGLSNAKARYVKDLADHILSGELDLDHVTTLSNPEIIAALTAVKGIGEWTAHMFLMFSLSRLDVLAWGDLGVRSAIKQVYNLPNLPTPLEVTDVAKRNNWHPYETVACWYLWKSLDNK